MAIEIKELVIKSTFVDLESSHKSHDDSDSSGSPSAADMAKLREGILTECKVLIREMFEQERGR